MVGRFFVARRGPRENTACKPFLTPLDGVLTRINRLGQLLPIYHNWLEDEKAKVIGRLSATQVWKKSDARLKSSLRRPTLDSLFWKTKKRIKNQPAPFGAEGGERKTRNQKLEIGRQNVEGKS